jgi:hypothetical protein
MILLQYKDACICSDVAMPYGTKEQIDFNKVYSDLIKPSLIHEGYEVFRADEEQAAGNIRT